MMKWILMVFEGWHTADTSKVHRQRAESIESTLFTRRVQKPTGNRINIGVGLFINYGI